MKNFKIPQEVHREDRIFGPITMRRLIILTLGGGFTYLWYLNLKDVGLTAWGPPVFFFGSFTLALSFLEPFGMRFEKFMARTIEFFSLPRKMFWDKRFTQNVFFDYLEYAHKKWQEKNAEKPDTQNIYSLKQKQKLSVEEISPLLEKDLSQIDLSLYNTSIEEKK